jgi:hypothetical protein
LVATVGEILKNREVSTLPTANSCPAVRAVITKQDQSLRIRIEDSNGRVSERTVAEVETAATLIESWARDDVKLPVPAPINDRTARKAETPVPTPTGTKLDKPIVERPAKAWVDIGAEFSAGFDGSTWFGGTVAACLSLGPVCAGALAGISVDLAATGDSQKLRTDRMGMVLVATVEYPIRLTPVSVRPGLGLGAEWLTMRRLKSDDENVELIDRRTIRILVDTHLRAAIDLGRGFALLTAIAVDFPVVSHTPLLKEGRTFIAGAPRGYIRGSVGVAYRFQ